MVSPRPLFALALLGVLWSLPSVRAANGNVYVSRFWHNHQPIYWPEWNSNGSQTGRGQYAWDSIVLKPGQTYGGITGQHPENNLTDIFGLQDRVTSYQSGPRNSLTTFNSAGGFAISYSGSLIDNVRQLGSVNQLGYGSSWNSGYKEARGWKTPSGSTRMDLVGFTYHHALAPLLPKSVFRKELQIFKQAWWKAWGGQTDLSDHSKGYFPTEMAYSRHLIDVLVDEGYQWVIVPSHHISRTCPTYNTKADPTGTYNIYSSPPNKADQLGPSPTNGWWFSEPNPGNAAWNVAPTAYQLHKVKYVNPETGAEKTMVAVPSDDVLSYRYGYANEGVGKIDTYIAPFATDSARPLIVMPATDGDNAWGGGSSSWMEATPQLFNDSASRGYKPSTPQDFVNAAIAAAGGANNIPVSHIEDGAWIFPEMDYGSPNFLKWIEPPVATVANRGITTVPGTQIDMETPGFALKFYSYAPLMAGANWCETAEQILKDEGGSAQAWKIQNPYNNLGNGQWSSPNEIEQAWHIYLAGLDSGFNYYGGLGNDDEIKPSLATRRAVEKLSPWMTQARRDKDKTGPTVLKPQRFPYNPGWYTFGWFNNVPGIDTRFLKRMNSEFYVWTHAYDLNGIPAGNVKLKVRVDSDGANPVDSNQNETYAGGGEVGTWVELAMTKKELPKTREALNAAAANSQIDYFLPVQADAVADYYFVKITDANLPNFRSKLLDYYIEATDAKGNVSKSEIQHVWVDDYSGATNGGGGGGGGTTSALTTAPATPVAGQSITVTYNPAGRNLSSASAVNIHYGYNGVSGNWTAVPGLPMTKSGTNWIYSYIVPSAATTIALCFNNGSGTWDNNGGGNWNFTVSTAAVTEAPSVPTGLMVQNVTTNSVSIKWTASVTAASYVVYRDGVSNATSMDTNFVDSTCQPDTEYAYSVAAMNAVTNSASCNPVVARTLFLPVASNGLRIVTPSSATTNTNGSFVFSGHAGIALTNGLIWSNAANGQTGSIAYTGATNSSGWAWLQAVTLANGPNTLTFSAAYPAAGPPVQTGLDSALNYTGWTSGTNGGTGFGAWSMVTSGAAGHFLASASNHANLTVNAAKGFGLYANSSGWVAARRNLPSAMEVGDVFTLRMDNNWIDSGGRVGVALATAGGVNRMNFYFIGGGSTYRIDDATDNRDSGTAYTGDGTLLTFTLTSSNSYSLSTGANVISGTLGGSAPITQLVASNSNAGPNTERNFYLGEMTFTEQLSTSAAVSAAAPAVTMQASDQTDGLPDSWWTQYAVPPDERVAAADRDSDGFTNAQEHALGTDPTSRASTFRVTSIRNDGSTTTVEWSAVAGKKYRLQATADLSGSSWVDVGAEVTAVQGADSASAGHSAAGSHFYRVRLVDP
jgi:Starch/carbohydrate-binding module (family 53)/Glycosyl hydrolase family 57